MDIVSDEGSATAGLDSDGVGFNRASAPSASGPAHPDAARAWEPPAGEPDDDGARICEQPQTD